MMKKGFTLAELLIALVILGVIATFTIPKILQNQQDSKKSAIAKEIIAAIAGAEQAYKQSNTLSVATTTVDIIPYLNLVKHDSVSSGGIINSDMDGDFLNSDSCWLGNGNSPCLLLHNGGVIKPQGFVGAPQAFGSTAGYHEFLVDPDGYKNISDSIVVRYYYNGRVTTWGADVPGYTDPAWFSWS